MNTRNPLTPYALMYIDNALHDEQISPPAPQNIRAVDEVLDILYTAHQSGGTVSAQQVWQKLQQQWPDLSKSPKPRWPILKAEALYNMPPLEYLYGKEIIKGQLHLLYGPSNIGKSFIVLDYALAIAQTQDVIYLASEGERSYGNRIQAWTTHYQKDAGRFYFTGEALPLTDEATVWQYISTIKDHHLTPALLIIDTLSWCIAGEDENSAGVMSRAVKSCRLLQQELGCAILLVHHTGKAGGAERGSSVLRGAVDVAIRIEDKDTVLEISCDKAKDSAPFPARYVERREILLNNEQTSCVIVASTREGSSPSTGLSANQLKVLEFLALATFEEAGAPSNKVKENVQVSNIYNVLSALKKEGYVSQGKRGDPFKITEAGRKVLENY